MNLASVLAFLAPFAGVIESGLASLEPQEKALFDQYVAQVQSPDWKAALQALEAAVMSFEDTEIKKL